MQQLDSRACWLQAHAITPVETSGPTLDAGCSTCAANRVHSGVFVLRSSGRTRSQRSSHVTILTPTRLEQLRRIFPALARRRTAAAGSSRGRRYVSHEPGARMHKHAQWPACASQIVMHGGRRRPGRCSMFTCFARTYDQTLCLRSRAAKAAHKICPCRTWHESNVRMHDRNMRAYSLIVRVRALACS